MAAILDDVHEFTHLFPEWALSWSLKLAATQAHSCFWAHATYRPPDMAEERLLAELAQGRSLPPLKYERTLLKNEEEYFGIETEVYRRTFWSYRPDFVVESEGASLFLILEAKGGQISEWRNPKELVYHRFLQSCTKPSIKGFFYIVPRVAAEKCADCLRNQFPADPSIATGLLTWEQLLPLIYDRLIETSLDQVIQEMEGLRRLRDWHKVAGLVDQ